MNILFVGDIFGKPGRRAASEIIPHLIRKRDIQLCIANGENAAGGSGIQQKIAEKLYSYNINVITTGNHVWDRKEVIPYLGEDRCLLRPANYPPEVPGMSSGVYTAKNGVPVAVLNLQGRIFMKEIDCPFRAAEKQLAYLKTLAKLIIVDFHAEATAEKVAMGWFLDGKVSAVIGTHTHVQTADETILPGGTAYITDVGMTGPHDSVIGIVKEMAIKRFLTQLPVKFEPAEGDIKFCAVLLDVDEKTGLSRSIERLRINLPGVEVTGDCE